MSDRLVEPVIVFVLYPDVTQLDFTGPAQVLARLPGARIVYASPGGGAVMTDCSFAIADTRALASIEACDIIVVPGGAGSEQVCGNEPALREIARLAAGARYITSVCTGSLILGAAGLLKGKRAACHWAWREMLPMFGATPEAARVVRDGNLFSGGGVTAGIDFALVLAAEIAGEDVARAIQLTIEYAPDPPFDSGTPDTAPEAVRKTIEARVAPRRKRLEALIAGQAAFSAAMK
jgi:transcriptional regulator GlxA family with amidase domain